MLAYSTISCSDNSEFPYYIGAKPVAFYDRGNNEDFQISNFIWPPVINDEYSVRISENGALDLNYYGTFVHPMLVKPVQKNLGAQTATQNSIKQTRMKWNFDHLSAWDFEPVLWIGKLATKKTPGLPKFRIENKWWGIQYTLATHWQRYQKQAYPGGYLAIHDKQLMVSCGSDGNHLRSTFSYVGSDAGDEYLYPAVEGFYVDNSLGNINGSKNLMVSGSLGFREGFLGHDSRRPWALGATGVKFTNFLSYWKPNFSHRLTAWEIGGFVDFRFLHKALNNGGHEETLETAVYPGQLLGTKSLFDALFVGFGVTSLHPEKDKISALVGYSQRLGNFSSNARIQHDFDRNDTSLVVSLSHRL